MDRLEDDQPSLRFAVNGITLIYGANASGNSGYCRIAKKLCRTLAPSRLRGNVYEQGAARAPMVRFSKVGCTGRHGRQDLRPVIGRRHFQECNSDGQEASDGEAALDQGRVTPSIA